MKTKIIALILLVSFYSKAQDIPKFNVGIDYLLLHASYENAYGSVEYSSRGGVFIEKPFQFDFLKPVGFSPGLSFKTIHENFGGGGLGGGSSSSLNHYSFSGYLKIIHKMNLEKIKPAVFYFGAFGGAHFYTWAKGSASSYSTLYPKANWKDSNYKEDPSHLFRKMYVGLLAGIEFPNKSFITPSFEVKYIPNYGEYKENVLSPVELSINLAFRTKT